MKISILFPRPIWLFYIRRVVGMSMLVLALSYSLKSFYKTIRSLFFFSLCYFSLLLTSVRCISWVMQFQHCNHLNIVLCVCLWIFPLCVKWSAFVLYACCFAWALSSWVCSFFRCWLSISSLFFRHRRRRCYFVIASFHIDSLDVTICVHCASGSFTLVLKFFHGTNRIQHSRITIEMQF